MDDAKNPKLILDPRFTHLVRAEGRAVLVGEDDFLLARDPTVEAVVRLVDGTRTAVEIARALAVHRRPEVVHYVLLLLEEEGVVRASDGPAVSPVLGTTASASTRRSWAKGTGQGLLRRRAALCNGAVHVTSAPGQGTTVEVRASLP